MPAEISEAARPNYQAWLLGPFVFMALLVVVRFVVELMGAPETSSQLLSSTGAILLVAIYLGAVAPLYGVRRSVKLVLPGVGLAAWTQLWAGLFTLISGAFELSRSHFASPEDHGNWAHLGGHLLGHMLAIIPFSVVVLLVMATMFLLWRWPITVAPGAVLGALVIVRFSAEALGMAATTSAAWSSSVGLLLCAVYLGGVAPGHGLTRYRQLLVPALVIGLTWRFWIFLAAMLSAAVPEYKTHFFDPSQGTGVMRLLGYIAGEFLAAGLFAGFFTWGLAAWTLRVVRPAEQ
jgi:hypothetical protein